MDPIAVLQKYYDSDSLAYHYLLVHSRLVARKAAKVAARVPHLKPDLEFIEEAALLHDIGVFLTRAPEIDCHGNHAYVCHGYLGREILERERLPRHALVCERHLGVGISRDEIRVEGLPLPHRDMVPISIEEQIICYADKFYSKNPDRLHEVKSIDAIHHSLSKYGDDKASKFDEWLRLFGG